MRARLEQPGARAKYRLRKQTVEPVFGVLKWAMGFTHFRLRGFAGAEIEWQLATLAYNCRRIHRLHGTGVERQKIIAHPDPVIPAPRIAPRCRTLSETARPNPSASIEITPKYNRMLIQSPKLEVVSYDLIYP